MEVFFLILMNVILPVFTLIGVGALLHRKFVFDMGTLSKLTTYLLMPAVSFVSIYESNIDGDTLLLIMSYLALQSIALMLLSSWLSKLFKFEDKLSAAFKNSVVLSNNGNFGLPVAQLVFVHNPLGSSIQVVVMIFQNLLTYTYGLYNSVSAGANGINVLKILLRNPVIYAFVLGVFFHAASISIPEFIWTPLESAANAFLAIALITLGAQSAFLKINVRSAPLILSLLGRLILSPCIAFLVILFLNLEGITAQALFIASSFPTSRNSSLFALEYGNHPEYAAQAVLLSTLCSMITVTTVVALSKILF